ncbi:MAG: sugar ABC transporter substrate-binding protein [Desulfurococcaceae archaeon]
MPLNTRIILVVAVLTIIVIGLLAYTLYTTQKQTQQQQQIVIRFSGWGAGETEVRNYEKAIAGFTEKYPNIIVKYEPISQMYHENILSSFPAGAAPDVFYVDSSWASIFIEQGALKPIDDIEQDITLLKAQYYEFLLQPFVGSDGKLYGLPKDWSILYLAYNKQCLAQAGLTTVPGDWSGFLASLEIVTDKTGLPALVDHYHWRTLVTIALSYGAPFPDFSSEQSIKSWFNNEAVKKALRDYMDLYLNGYVRRVEAGKVPYVVLPRDVDSGWGGEAFGKQKACFTLEGSWMIPFIRDQFPNFKFGEQWDIAVLPQGPAGRITLAFTVILGINSRSSHVNEAYQFAKYIAGKEGQEFLVVKLGHTLPSVKELANHTDLWPEHRKTLEQLSKYDEVYVWPVMKSNKAGVIISTIDNILQSYVANMKETKTYDLNNLVNDLVNGIIAAIK